MAQGCIFFTVDGREYRVGAVMAPSSSLQLDWFRYLSVHAKFVRKASVLLSNLRELHGIYGQVC